MSVKDIRDGLVTRLQTIDGLRVSTRVPDLINPPAAMGRFSGARFNTTFDSADDPRFTIRVFTSKSSDRGEDALYDYIDGDGAESIRLAIDGDPTLGGAADFAVVTEVNEMAVTESKDGVKYYTVDFTVEVGA